MKKMAMRVAAITGLGVTGGLAALGLLALIVLRAISEDEDQPIYVLEYGRA